MIRVLHRANAWLRNMNTQDWGWIHFKLAIGVLWPVFTLMRLPIGVELTLQEVVVYLWMGMTMLGAAMCIAGIIMAAQAGTKWRPMGVTIELAGLILMFAGPFVLVCVYLYLDWFTESEVRTSWVVLAYAVCAAILARGLQVIPRVKREARDDTKQV